MSTNDPEHEAELEAELDASLVAATDDKPEHAIWHYSAANGVLGILESKKIWATHYGYTNDPNEIRIGERAIKEVIVSLASSGSPVARQVFKALAKRYEEESLPQIADVYVACFTEDVEHPGDELAQWRGYGDAGAGYSLGLFPAPVAGSGDAQNARLATYLVRVEYDVRAFQAKARACFERMLGVHNAQQQRGVGRESLLVGMRARGYSVKFTGEGRV